MHFCIPEILNKSSNNITDKIKATSTGFTLYLKCFLANEYNLICSIPITIYVPELLIRKIHCTRASYIILLLSVKDCINKSNADNIIEKPGY